MKKLTESKITRRSLLANLATLLGAGVLNSILPGCKSSALSFSRIDSITSPLTGGPALSTGPSPVPTSTEVPPAPIDTIPAAITPAWFGSHAVHEWFAIPNSVHAGSPAAPTDDPANAYCASTARLAFSNIGHKDTQVVLAACGGHSDYSGNEVTGIELGVDSPTWSLLHAGTPVAGRIPNAAYFADGTPASRHTYNSTIFSTTRNRFMLHYTRFVWTNAISFGATNGFNLDNNTWDPAGSFNSGMSASCRDSRDNVWASSNYFELWKWTATTDTWAKTGTFPNQTSNSMAHDSRRDQLFQLSWGDNQGDSSGVWSYIYTQEGTQQIPITFNNSAAYTQFQADQPNYASLVYDPVNDQFLFWDGVSGRLYQIKPNSGTTWDMNIIATTGATPPVRSQTYGRMAYIAALRGVVIMPAGHQSLYFLRLS